MPRTASRSSPPQDAEQLLAAVSAQDAAPPFRRLLGATLPSRKVLAARAADAAVAAAGESGAHPAPGDPGPSAQAAAVARSEVVAKKARQYAGNRVVVCVADNPATQVCGFFVHVCPWAGCVAVGQVQGLS